MNLNIGKGTHVNIELDSQSNEILTKSALRNKRTKRAEAAIRLNHHLATFNQTWEAPEESEDK